MQPSTKFIVPSQQRALTLQNGFGVIQMMFHICHQRVQQQETHQDAFIDYLGIRAPWLECVSVSIP